MLVFLLFAVVHGTFLDCLKNVTMHHPPDVRMSAANAFSQHPHAPCAYVLHSPGRPERFKLMETLLNDISLHIYSAHYVFSMPWINAFNDERCRQCYVRTVAKTKEDGITLSMNMGHMAAWIDYTLRSDCRSRPMLMFEDDAILNAPVDFMADVVRDIAVVKATSETGMFVNLGQCVNAWLGSSVTSNYMHAFLDKDQRHPLLRQLAPNAPISPTYCLTSYALDQTAVSVMLGTHGIYSPIFLEHAERIVPIDHLVNRLTEHTTIKCYYPTHILFKPSDKVTQKSAM